MWLQGGGSWWHSLILHFISSEKSPQSSWPLQRRYSSTQILFRHSKWVSGLHTKVLLAKKKNEMKIYFFNAVGFILFYFFYRILPILRHCYRCNHFLRCKSRIYWCTNRFYIWNDRVNKGANTRFARRNRLRNHRLRRSTNPKSKIFIIIIEMENVLMTADDAKNICHTSSMQRWFKHWNIFKLQVWFEGEHPWSTCSSEPSVQSGSLSHTHFLGMHLPVELHLK